MGDVPGDVDISPRDVERAAIDGVPVGIGDGRFLLVDVIAEDGGADPDGRRVIGRRIPRRRRDLRVSCSGDDQSHERQTQRSSQAFLLAATERRRHMGFMLVRGDVGRGSPVLQER
jgi:hypothetical protein